MLHELIFALNGNHGNIFTLDGDSFRINDSLPLFHPAEASRIKELLELGEKYWKICRFIKVYENNSSGFYLEAICEGLDSVLESYRASLRSLEKAVLFDKITELSFFVLKLRPHAPVLTALANLIHHIEIRKIRGCYLLDIIYKASCSGYVRVEMAMKRLLREGHKVMYKQLLAWLLQGMLYDPTEEFFIVRSDEDSTVHYQERGSSTQNPYPSGDYGEFQSRTYRLKVESLPSYISTSTAEKIFFIGESVQLFELDRRVELQGSVLKERETEFYQKLSELRECDEFRICDFEKSVDEIRQTASRHLHDLVLSRSNLRQELSTVRDFFLLGRGELFQTFILVADKYLQTPPSATTKHDASQAFINSTRSIISDDERIIKKIKVSLSQPSSTTIQSGWSILSLTYAVPWPLHLIFTPTTLDQYNKIFQFLILVKRTQLKLNQCWAKEMTSKRTSEHWRLRSHMMFIIDNLQHYLMADVLDSQYSVLSAALDKSCDFEELKTAHQEFISSLSFHIFINNKPVYECITELLSTCLSFSALALSDSSDSSQYEVISLKFARHAGLFFQILSTLHHHHTGSHLAKLLLRIDFNRYFFKHGHSLEHSQ